MRRRSEGAKSAPSGAVFRPVARREDPVLPGDRNTVRSEYRLYRGRDGFEVAVAEHLLERIVLWAKKPAPLEAFGLLVGRVYEDPRGRHVVVLGLVPDPEAKAERFFVETTPTSEFRTRMSASLLFPDATILGWIHTHPRLGARYSGVDHANQATWKAQHALGIVCDPWDPEVIAVYRGPESELLMPVVARDRANAFDADEKSASQAGVTAESHTSVNRDPSVVDTRAERKAPARPPSSAPDAGGAAARVSSVPSSPRRRWSFTSTLSTLVYLALLLAAALASIALWRTRDLDDRVSRLEAQRTRDQTVVVTLVWANLPSAATPDGPQVCDESNQSLSP